MPLAMPYGAEAESIDQLGGGHGGGDVLLVGDDQERQAREFLLVQQAPDVVSRLAHVISAVAVDNKDNGMLVSEI